MTARPRDTAELVERFAARAPFESPTYGRRTGFRAAAIRNRAVARHRADYVVFTDGDCIPSRTFVHQHRRLAEPGWFLSGNRVLLSPQFTAAVLDRASARPRVDVGRLGAGARAAAKSTA